MRARLVVLLFAFLATGIGLAATIGPKSLASPVSMSAVSGARSAGHGVVLNVKKDDDDMCKLCRVCVKEPDGPNKGQFTCFPILDDKDTCKKKIKTVKQEGEQKGFKISAFCDCEKKPCSCKGKQCP